MIQKIIGKFSELVTLRRINDNIKRYKVAYFVIVITSFCISILPFQFEWIKSVGTEPQEAIARLIRDDGAMGTAFLISPTKMLTARHVVEGYLGKKVELIFEQAKIPFSVSATVEYYDERVVADNSIEYFESDVALLSVDEISYISPLNLGNSDEFKTGAIVIMGFGSGDWSEPDGKITSSNYHKNSNLYKLDASVNSGHSGSPVLTKDLNKVIGIVVGKPNAIFTLQTQGQILDGENIVLKVNQADKVLQRGGELIR